MIWFRMICDFFNHKGSQNQPLTQSLTLDLAFCICLSVFVSLSITSLISFLLHIPSSPFSLTRYISLSLFLSSKTLFISLLCPPPPLVCWRSAGCWRMRSSLRFVTHLSWTAPLCIKWLIMSIAPAGGPVAFISLSLCSLSSGLNSH